MAQCAPGHADADVVQLTRCAKATIAAECRGDLVAATLDDDAVVLPPDAPAREGEGACLSFMRDVLGALLALRASSSATAPRSSSTATWRSIAAALPRALRERRPAW
jgi:hypothetical protein